MLRITNGKQILTVSKGAFKELYSPSGWVVVDNTPAIPLQEPAEGPGGGGDSKPTIPVNNLPEGPSNGLDGDESLDEEDTLQNMSEIELKQYASLLGIKTKTLKTREELMRAIKAHQE